jgi:hypothetical protein
VLQFDDRGCVVIRSQPINRKKIARVLPDEECLGKAACRTGEETKGCLENRAGRITAASAVPPASRDLGSPGAGRMNRQGRLDKLPWDA